MSYHTSNTADESLLSVVVDNPDFFSELSAKITTESGFALSVTLSDIEVFLSRAIALFFSSDASRDYAPLHPTFDSHLVARLSAHPARLEAVVPTSATLHLVAAEGEETPVRLRIHLALTSSPVPVDRTILRQFWDLLVDPVVTIQKASICEVCNTTLSPQLLVCQSCGHDMHTTTMLPLQVGHIDIY